MVPIDTLHETNNIAPENSGPQKEISSEPTINFQGLCLLVFREGRYFMENPIKWMVYNGTPY